MEQCLHPLLINKARIQNAPSNYKRSRETVPIQQNINTPFAGYRQGVDPEFNYGFRNPSAGEIQTRFLNQGGSVADYVNPTMLSKGGIATFAEGGDVVEARRITDEHALTPTKKTLSYQRCKCHERQHARKNKRL